MMNGKPNVIRRHGVHFAASSTMYHYKPYRQHTVNQGHRVRFSITSTMYHYNPHRQHTRNSGIPKPPPHFHADSHILDRRLALLPPTPVLPDMLLARALVLFKHGHLGAIHIFDDVIGLPLLEAEADALVRVVLIVGLVFVVLDLDELSVGGSGVERERDKRIDGRGFREQFEGPRLDTHAQLRVSRAPGRRENRKCRFSYGGFTCSFLNWIKSRSFTTTWYPSHTLFLNSFGSANHWPAILYRSLAYTNWSSYTQSGVYRFTRSTVGWQLYSAITSSTSACRALFKGSDLDGSGL